MIPQSRSDLIVEYHQQCWAMVPVPSGEKRPAVKNWPGGRFVPADFDGKNIAIKLGAVSGDLIDIDLDCDEALELADLYLPPTGAIFGRKSKPQSHRLYVASGAVFEAFYDPLRNEKKTLLELRATGATGGVHLTLVPPSIAGGEQRVWHGDVIDPASIDTKVLRQRIAWLAIGCLVARYISPSAARIPAPDFPRLLWEFDHDLARPAYDWLGRLPPDAPRRYPRRRAEQDPRDLDLAEICAAIPNNYDWHGWNDIGLAIFAAARDGGDGFVIFDDFSAKSAAYDPHETQARWRNYEKHPPNRTGIGKLARLAYEAGWRPNGRAA